MNDFRLTIVTYGVEWTASGTVRLIAAAACAYRLDWEGGGDALLIQSWVAGERVPLRTTSPFRQMMIIWASRVAMQPASHI